jgi:WD40 repeat protein
MADDSLVDAWLDRWEETPNRDDPSSLDQFVAEHCASAPRDRIDEFRAKVRDLQVIDYELLPLITQRWVEGESDLGSEDIDLKAGAEPVPGYRLVARLGAGGFGEVWKAHAPGGFPVALKLVRLENGRGADEQESLKVLKEFQHPSLVTIFSAWCGEKWFVVAMELAEKTLQHRLLESFKAGQAGIPFPELISYMSSVADGIDFLHEPRNLDGQSIAGVQHGDIKPLNLLLARGWVKIADFGLLRVMRRTQTGHAGAMTNAYAPPEFFNGQSSRNSDQYSLAVTYCQLRGGRLPFDGQPAQIVAGHLYEPPDLSMIPDDERPAVARALAKDPHDRWPSCMDFVRAIKGDTSIVGVDSTQVGITTGGSGKPLPRMVRRFEGHVGGVRALAFSRDGRELFSGGDDMTVRRWDMETGKQLGCFQGHKDVVLALSVNSDENQAVSVGQKGTVRVWDVLSGRKIHQINEDDQGITCAAVRSDGTATMFGSSGKAVYLSDGCPRKTFELSKPQEQTGVSPPSSAFSRAATSVAFTREGSHALIASCGVGMSLSVASAIEVFNIENGAVIRTITGPRSVVRCLAASIDGRGLACGDERGEIRYWYANTGELSAPAIPTTDLVSVHLDGHPGTVYSIAFSSDGTKLLSGGVEGDIRLWRLDRNEVIWAVRAHEGKVRAVAFDPEGRHVVTAGPDALILWDFGDSV